MSKKRKTRQQKVIAAARHTEHAHIHVDTPTYSIANLKPSLVASETTKEPLKSRVDTTVAQKDAAYLRHDMVAITAASGIVTAFDILLFVLLTTGVLHLRFLGY